MKFYIKTLGCKLNQSESDSLKDKLVNYGHKQSEIDRADFLILNACSVTQFATNKSINIINKYKTNKNGKIVVMGCLDKKFLNKVDYVVKNKENVFAELKSKFKLVKLARPLKGPDITRNRAQIKIQTGCDNFCSYCIIPYFRGKPRSFTTSQIIKEIKATEKKGINEIVLTGVNICKYKSGGLDLTGLVKNILAETKIPRIRLGSLDPALIDFKFINLFKNKRLMPSWHLSLQSGSNNILKSMNRKYTTQQYFDLTKKALKINKNFLFTTDVIVGFPGETKKNFQETIKFVRNVRFLKIHVFPYSIRPNTKAGLMTDQIPENIKKQRSRELRETSLALTEKFISKNLSKRHLVLLEGERDGYWFGYTENFIRIKYKSLENLRDQIKDLKITRKNVEIKHYQAL